MEKISVSTNVSSPVEKVREMRTKPEHITKRCFAQDDRECPAASNDLKVGGTFSTTMAAKDKSVSFDWAGVYTNIIDHKLIEYEFDTRTVSISFEESDGETKVIESFDPEDQNPREMQQAGWQAILDNFKKYVEAN